VRSTVLLRAVHKLHQGGEADAGRGNYLPNRDSQIKSYHHCFVTIIMTASNLQLFTFQDDDYDSVVKRFGVITGEAEAESSLYRIAVVFNKIPYFIPRVTSTGAVGASVQEGTGEGGGDTSPSSDGGITAPEKPHSTGNGNTNSNSNSNGHNVTEKEKAKKEKGPSFWAQVSEKYRFTDAVNYLKNKNLMQSKENRFPQLGIQRSVTAASSQGGMR
jgi:hypothetical protein